MLVTLTTDFGHRDGYVAAMKGAMLSAEPGLTLVDVTHEVPAQDVMEAAFVLRQAAPYFPAHTVHLAVVDPGVGTARRAVAARFELAVPGGEPRPFTFVGPDNGLLTLVAGGGPPALGPAVLLDDVRPGVSATFHGRDVFGPAAAALAAGAELESLGPPVDALAPLHWPLPRVDREGVTGMVVHVDGFGNCLTNVTRDDVERHRDDRPFRCYVGAAAVDAHVRTYGETEPGEPLTLFGSSGHLEVAVCQGNAARLLSVKRGDPVTLVFESDRAPAPSARPRPRPHLVAP